MWDESSALQPNRHHPHGGDLSFVIIPMMTIVIMMVVCYTNRYHVGTVSAGSQARILVEAE